MPKPKTAKLTLEILNEDGSKTIVTTEDLDASKLPERGNTADWQDHIEIGMRDPYYDPEDYYQRRSRWVNEHLALPSIPSHFFLKLQLAPVDKGKHVYHIQEIEPPMTRVVAYYNSRLKKVQITSYDEQGDNNIQDTAAIFQDSIYFFLDIPS